MISAGSSLRMVVIVPSCRTVQTPPGIVLERSSAAKIPSVDFWLTRDACRRRHRGSRRGSAVRCDADEARGLELRHQLARRRQPAAAGSHGAPQIEHRRGRAASPGTRSSGAGGPPASGSRGRGAAAPAGRPPGNSRCSGAGSPDRSPPQVSGAGCRRPLRSPGCSGPSSAMFSPANAAAASCSSTPTAVSSGFRWLAQRMYAPAPHPISSSRNGPRLGITPVNASQMNNSTRREERAITRASCSARVKGRPASRRSGVWVMSAWCRLATSSIKAAEASFRGSRSWRASRPRTAYPRWPAAQFARRHPGLQPGAPGPLASRARAEGQPPGHRAEPGRRPNVAASRCAGRPARNATR